jgi:serine/threonine protein kinase
VKAMPELRLENSLLNDRYLIERCLSRGSYAEIFLAREASGERVIIKALNPALQGTPDAELERTLVENFQNEALALDKVRHPNIIRRLGHGTAADLEGTPFHYLVLEYMPGGDMLSLCRTHPLSLTDTLFYFHQVCEALAYAHNRQVIHRDIKPNNLLLSADHRTVKIADFGVAKLAVDDHSEITRVGTNIYAPPEHHPDSLTGSLNERLTPSADIYSLAKTIYTAMTGCAPRQFVRQPIASLPAQLACEPWADELLMVLNKATQTRVSDRYQSVHEFWQQFTRIAEHAASSNEEATLVRSRHKLEVHSHVLSIDQAPAPAFEAPASSESRPQKARIIIELPHQPQATVFTQQTPPIAHELHKQGSLRVKAAEPRQRLYKSLRSIHWSDWLRRTFALSLVLALIGLVTSTYYYFADRKWRALPDIPILGALHPEGTISGALNVNLRSDPGGEPLVWVPAGTRVRVYESKGGWLRVKILRWAEPPPGDAPDSGWVDRRYVRLDQ